MINYIENWIIKYYNKNIIIKNNYNEYDIISNIDKIFNIDIDNLEIIYHFTKTYINFINEKYNNKK
jgi:hypothetical protein